MRSLLRRYREPLFVALLLALPFTVFAVKAKQKVALNAADRVVIAVTAPVEKLIVAAVHVGQDAWHDYVALGSVREENFRASHSFVSRAYRGYRSLSRPCT